MIKVYHLSTCDTCRKIIRQWELPETAILQDIKTEQITPEQLDEMAHLTGSYEALFSRKAIKYRAMGLHEQVLAEADYCRFILEEYTFLKRPVVLVDGKIYVGNTKAVVDAAAERIVLSKNGNA